MVKFVSSVFALTSFSGILAVTVVLVGICMVSKY